MSAEPTLAAPAAPRQAPSPALNAYRPRPVTAMIALVTAALLTMALPLAAPTLNAMSFSGLPLGYYLGAQGSMLLVALLAIWLSGPWSASSHARRFACFRASFPATGSWLTAGMLLTLTGALFVAGFDGLPLYLGLAAGLFLSLVFVAPALDRAGALHADELLGALTGSRYAAGMAGLAIAVGLILLVSVELEVARLGAAAAGLETSGLPEAAGYAALAAIAVIVALLAPRNIRAWGLTVSLIGMLIAVLICISPMTSGGLSAVPQLAVAGPLADLTATERQLLSKGLADPVVMPPFVRPFVQVSILNFLALSLSVALGAAVLPHMLWRRRIPASATLSSAPALDQPHNRYPTRQKAAFGLALAAIVMTALPALAVIGKLEIYRSVSAGLDIDAAPTWLSQGTRAGFLRVCGESGKAALVEPTDAAGSSDCGRAGSPIRIADLAINPVGIVFLLPHMAGFTAPWAQALAAAIAMFAMIAAAATLRMAVDAVLAWSKDRSAAPVNDTRDGSTPIRFLVTGVLAAAAVAAVVGLNESPVNRLYWAFSVLGGALLPMLLICAVLPRINGIALALGGFAGLAVGLYYVIGTTSIFAPQFALYWSAISDAPPWLLDDLRASLEACRTSPGTPQGLEACSNALELGRELSNWFGIDARAGGAIAAPVATAVALVTGALFPSFWRREA